MQTQRSNKPSTGHDLAMLPVANPRAARRQVGHHIAVGLLTCLLVGESGAQRVDKQAPEALAEGAGWRLVDIDPGGTSGANTLAWQVSAAGVAALPVSDQQKALLQDAFADDPHGPEDVVYASQELFQAMESPDFPVGYEHYIDTQALRDAEPERTTDGFSFGCAWSTTTRLGAWPLSSQGVDKTFPFANSGLSGRLSLNVPVSGQAQGSVTYKVRRCAGVPVGFKLASATVSGTATTSGAGSLQASLVQQFSWKDEWLLAEPSLGSVAFMVGPLPIRLIFTLPIYAGAGFDVRVAGTVAAQFDAAATGSFAYTCTLSSCTGSNDVTGRFEFVQPSASVSVDATARAYLRVTVRLGVYSSKKLYVEGGLEATAVAHLWAYTGNTCGDADGDGRNETVQALLADLSWNWRVAYGWGGHWLPEDRLHYTGGVAYPLGFRDLLGPGGSTVLTPMISGPASVTADAPATYTVRMRPCYPFTDGVNLAISPGTWTGTPVVSAPPIGSASLSRTFWTPGVETIAVSVLSDHAGRNLVGTTSRPLTVTANAPSAPTGLAASALSTSSVRLNWIDTSANETAFVISRRMLPGGAFAVGATVAANTTTYVDTGLAPATGYEYRVRAHNGTLASAESNVANVATPQLPPPAPASLSASALTANSVRVAWVDGSNNEAQFEIQRRLTPVGAFALVAAVGADVVAYTDTSLAAATTYEYRVRASNGGGASAFSNIASATTPAANRPPAAVDDSATTHFDVARDIVVIANDSDPDGQPVALLAAPVVTAPAHGTVARVSGSTLRYTPNAGFVGTDSLRYEIGDGAGGRARAWATVDVTNNAPAAANDSTSMRRNTTLNIAVTANDSDPDGDPIWLVSSPIVTSPAHGSATRVSDSTVAYKPTAGYTGPDTFQYEIGDGSGRRSRAWVTVSITP